MYPDTNRYEYIYYLHPLNELVICIIKEDDQKKQKLRNLDLQSRIEPRVYIVQNCIVCLLVYFVLYSYESLQKECKKRQKDRLVLFLPIKTKENK